MDYQNPFGLYNDVNPVPSNPFWSGMMGAQNRATAAPFIEMSGRNQALDLQSKEETEPLKTQVDVQKYKDELRSAPYVTDEKIAKAIQGKRDIESTPYRELYTTMGNHYDQLKSAPESAKPMVWDSMVRQWEQTHQGMKVPQELRQYRPEHEGDLAAIRYAQIHNPETEQKNLLEKTKTTSAEGIAAGNNTTALEVARIHERGQNTRASMQHEDNVTPDKLFARMIRKAGKEGLTEDEAATLPALVEDQFLKSAEGQSMKTAMSMAALQASSDGGKALDAVQEHMKKIRSNYWKNKGLGKFMPADLQSNPAPGGGSGSVILYDTKGQRVSQ